MGSNKILQFFIICLFFLVILNASTIFGQNNMITFDNQSGEQAVVNLIGPSSKIVVVPKGSRQSVNAKPGSYYIEVRYGTKRNTPYIKGEKFIITESGTENSSKTITLHKVVAGNDNSHPIIETKSKGSGDTGGGKGVMATIRMGADYTVREASETAMFLLAWGVGILGCALILIGLVLTFGFGTNIGNNSEEQVYVSLVGSLLAGVGCLLAIKFAPWLSPDVFSGNNWGTVKGVGAVGVFIGIIVRIL